MSIYDDDILTNHEKMRVTNKNTFTNLTNGISKEDKIIVVADPD